MSVILNPNYASMKYDFLDKEGICDECGHSVLKATLRMKDGQRVCSNCFDNEGEVQEMSVQQALSEIQQQIAELKEENSKLKSENVALRSTPVKKGPSRAWNSKADITTTVRRAFRRGLNRKQVEAHVVEKHKLAESTASNRVNRFLRTGSCEDS